MLRLVLCIEVIEVAEELIEAMHRREELVRVAEVVLAELPRGIAERLEQLGERRIPVGQSLLGARQAHLQQSSSHRALSGDESRPPGSTGLLAIVVGQDRSL